MSLALAEAIHDIQIKQALYCFLDLFDDAGVVSTFAEFLLFLCLVYDSLNN